MKKRYKRISVWVLVGLLVTAAAVWAWPDDVSEWRGLSLRGDATAAGPGVNPPLRPRGTRPPFSQGPPVPVPAFCESYANASLTGDLADAVYQHAREIVRANNPHPHYNRIYGEQESMYWGPQIPAWMLSHICEQSVASGHVPPFRHLDVGIAYGTLSVLMHLLSSNSSDVHGIDYFDSALSKDLSAAVGITSSYVNVEVNPLPANYTPGFFDALLLTETLEHFNYNPLPTLGKLSALLKPNGVLWLSTPNGGPPGYDAYATWRDMPMPPSIPLGVATPQLTDGHVYEYGPEEVVDLITSAGFVIDCIARNDERYGHIVLQARKPPAGGPNAVTPVCQRTEASYCICKP